MTSTSRLIAGLLLACSAATAMAADGSEIEQVRATTMKLIDLLVQQGVLTRANADALIQEANKAGAAAAATQAKAAPPATVRVPYVPESIRKEIKEEVKQELAEQAESEGWAGPGAVPEWVRGLRWDGDLRFRAQGDNFSSSNSNTFANVATTNSTRATQLLNTTEDRARLRMRARLGVNAVIDDNWSTGVRLATGSATDPVSLNQTLGNYGNRYTVALDRAFIRYRRGDQLNVVAGRFGNPWFGTDLVWANDLSFDGITAQWTPQLAARARGFLTVAALPVQEVELSSADKWLFGAQVGGDWAGSSNGIGGKLGLGYFHYTHAVGKTSPAGSSLNEFTAPQFAQKGNTYYNISSDSSRPLLALASEYRLVNLTGALDVPVAGGNHVLLTGDFVKNVGFKRADVSARVGSNVDAETKGYQLKLAFGARDVRQAGEWQLFTAYKRVEADAVPDAFTDSDFHLGGTNAKGYILGASYGVGKNAWATVRYLSADVISGPPLSVDVLQLDLNVRF